MLIQYVHINAQLKTSDFENLQQQLPEFLKRKNQGYLKYEDRQRNLFGLLLLKRQWKSMIGEDLDFSRLQKTEFTRPYIPGSHVDFNISHSGDYVVCVLKAKAKVGIDIERRKVVNFSDFERTMNQGQWKEIYHSSNPTNTFFKYWCIKESVIKADGRGLSIPLTEIEFSNEQVTYPGHIWQIKSFQIDDHHFGCIASDLKISNLELEEVNWRQLLGG